MATETDIEWKKPACPACARPTRELHKGHALLQTCACGWFEVVSADLVDERELDDLIPVWNPREGDEPRWYWVPHGGLVGATVCFPSRPGAAAEWHKIAAYDRADRSYATAGGLRWREERLVPGLQTGRAFVPVLWDPGLESERDESPF